MSLSSSASDRQRVAVMGAKERGTTSTPITLSERSITGFALIRIFVGYLWFQQLFWKLPPDFRGLYPYIIRESQHTNYPRLRLHSSAHVSCWLFQPVNASRLHGVCTTGGVYLDGRAAGDH